MSPLLRPVVAIDPSGRRLVLAARGGGDVPSRSAWLRSEREGQRMEEAADALREFTARHGLRGGEARLCIPSSHLFLSTLELPPLRERDLEGALAIELERLFPVPSSRLLFGWRPLGKSPGGKGRALAVAAAPRDFVERWRECAAGAGLSFAAAVPAPWALARFLAEEGGGGERKGVSILLRDAGGDAEATVLRDGEPLFSAVRPGTGEGSLAAALEAAEAGLASLPSSPAGAAPSPPRLLLPARWEGSAAASSPAFRAVPSFEERFAAALPSPAPGDPSPSPLDLAAAWGAGSAPRSSNLLARGGPGYAFRALRYGTAAAALAAAVFAAAWPASVAHRTREAAARLEREVESLRPAAAKVEAELSALAAVEGRAEALRAAGAERAETLRILKELTDRVPQGSWLTGIRIEGRKVEIDGVSSAANELFPHLSRDDRFRKVEFASPITRQGDNLERFQIRAEYSPPAEAVGGKP